MMTGCAWWPRLSLRASSRPLMPGRWRSAITRSLAWRWSQAQASSALVNVSIVNPSSERPSARAQDIAGSSSTIRMCGMGSGSPWVADKPNLCSPRASRRACAAGRRARDGGGPGGGFEPHLARSPHRVRGVELSPPARARSGSRSRSPGRARGRADRAQRGGDLADRPPNPGPSRGACAYFLTGAPGTGRWALVPARAGAARPGSAVLARVLGIVVEREFLELGAQGLARDAEQLGGAGLVALAHPERVLDRQLLDLDQRAHHPGGERTGRTRGTARRGAAARQLGGQVLGADLVLGLEQHDALDDVAQLAHVAGPGIALHGLERVGMEADRGPPQGAAEVLDEVLGE